MDNTAVGSNETLHVKDFVVPYEEKYAGLTAGSKTGFTEFVTECDPLPSDHVVVTELPQEVRMVKEFARLVKSIKENGAKPDSKWPDLRLRGNSFNMFSDPWQMHSIFTFTAGPEFLNNDIRVKPDLDALGALGDLGWYCTRSILWAANYELPKTVAALRGPIFNNSGVLLACGASLQWEDGKVATFHCSFLSNLRVNFASSALRTEFGPQHFYTVDYKEHASFTAGSKTGFTEFVTGWDPLPSDHVVVTELPQEARMVREFARLVKSIIENGAKPDSKWPAISRKTQQVLDAVKKSIENDFQPVEIVS
ncbi:hypothetical protein ACHQM5_022310 [Ranunculus cassubicifolius]